MATPGPINKKGKLPERRSIRLRGFDYSQAGVYFVTICADRRRALFGKVVDGSMRLNWLGRIVEQTWLEIPLHCANVGLDAHVVMPNHLHGILVVYKRARHAVPLPVSDQHAEAFGQPREASIPTIVRSFKAAVTKKVHERIPHLRLPVWQRGYFEHVIRPGDNMGRIIGYIYENPKRWLWDKENPHRRTTAIKEDPRDLWSRL